MSSRYRERGQIVGDGHAAEWLPLVHPGVLKGSPSHWAEHHARWEEQMRQNRLLR
jgi:hypothetical protein